MKLSSSTLTLGSGTGYTITDQSQGTGPGEIQYRYYTGRPEKHSFIIPGAWGYRSLDLRLEKRFEFGESQAFSLVGEVFNVFDYENYDPRSYNGNIPFGGATNEAFGKPTELIEPGRRFVGMSYSFAVNGIGHPTTSWEGEGVFAVVAARGYIHVPEGLGVMAFVVWTPWHSYTMRLHDSFSWPRLVWLLAAALFVSVAGAAEQKPTKPKVPGVVVERSRVFDPERDGDPVINNLQRRTFRFFWDTTNKQNGLAPDRFPSPSFASTAAVELRAHGLCGRFGAGLRVALASPIAHVADVAIPRVHAAGAG